MISLANTNLLSDTLNVVQLARQAAIARGNPDRAGKFSSVASELHKVVIENGQVKGNGQAGGLAAGETFHAEGDTSFHSLLSAAHQQHEVQQAAPAAPAPQIVINEPSDLQERNVLVTAMAAGTMNEVDIARQLGITRDEVRAIISLNRANNAPLSSPAGGES